MRFSKAQQKESRDWLRETIAPGDTVCTILRRVARSGMSRRIDLCVVRAADPVDVRYLTYHAARLIGWGDSKTNNGAGMPVSGCGMDMGFHLVYTLSAILFRGDPRVTGDPGYALKHRWL